MPDKDKIIREKIVFMEMPDLLDSVAHTLNSHIKYYLERVLDRKFNGWNVTNISPIGESKIKGRHPKSVLDKDNPFLSFTYLFDAEYTDLALGSSSFITDAGSFIDPKWTSDVLFTNSDKQDISRNVEIRIQFSNVEMNCDIATLEDTEMCQLATRRAWDVLFEKDRVYSIIAEVKFPLNKRVYDRWCEIFKLDNTDTDAVMKHMQERSDFKLTHEMRTTQQKDTIFIRIPMELLITFTQSEVRLDDEQMYLVKNYIVARQMNVKFNAPTMYWVNPKERYPILKVKAGTGIIQNPGILTVDKINDTYEKDGVLYTCKIWKLLRFPEKKDENVVTLRPMMGDYESFIRYLVRMNIPMNKAFYILIREVDDPNQAYSYESTKKVGINYSPDFFVKLFEEKIRNQAFDLRVYINEIEHVKFLEWREEFIWSDYHPIYDIANREEIKISDELLDKIKG